MISLALIVLSGLVLLGWAFNITVLKSIFPQFTPMKPNTAISFLLAGLALWFMDASEPGQDSRISQMTALFIFLIGLLTVSEYLFGLNLGIDQLLFKNSLLGTDAASGLRMSEATAYGISLLGLSLILLSYTHQYTLLQICALCVFGLGLFIFAGYLFSISSLQNVLLFNNVSLLTAFGFCLAGTAVLLASSKEGVIAVIAQNNLGGVMARRLLPATLIVPLVIGWLRLQGQYRGYYNTEFGLALFAVSNIIILTIFVWWTARTLNRIDVQHQEATRRLNGYARRMEILHNIDLGIIASQDAAEIALSTFKELRDLIPCERISLKLVDEATHELVVYAADSVNDPLRIDRIPLLPKMLEGFDEHHTRLIDDLRIQHAQVPLGDEYLEQGFLTLFQVLLIQDGVVQGLVTLASMTLSLFTPEYRQIAVEVVNQLAIVIKQMRLSENLQKSNVSLERYARRMEILHKIDQGIITAQAVPDLIETTLKQLRKVIPCERIAVSLLDANTQELVIYAADSDRENPFETMRLPPSAGLFEGFTADNIRFFEDLRLVQDRIPQLKSVVERGFLILFQVLLVQDSRPIGFVSLSASTLGFFIPEYREIAFEVSTQLAIVLNQMRLSDELQRSHDTLEQRVIERTAELNAAKEQVEAILNNSLDGILLTDVDLGIKKTNSAFEKLFGRNIAVAATQSLLDMVAAEDAQLVVVGVQTALSGVGSNTVEVKARSENGSTFDAELSIGHIVDDGLVLTVHDISSRKAAERQLRYQASIQNTVADAVLSLIWNIVSKVGIRLLNGCMAGARKKWLREW